MPNSPMGYNISHATPVDQKLVDNLFQPHYPQLLQEGLTMAAGPESIGIQRLG